LRDRFIAGVAAVTVVIAGTDHQLLAAFAQQAEIFFHHRDLHVDVQGRTQVEQVASDHEHVILLRMRQQPVELFQRKVQVC